MTNHRYCRHRHRHRRPRALSTLLFRIVCPRTFIPSKEQSASVKSRRLHQSSEKRGRNWQKEKGGKIYKDTDQRLALFSFCGKKSRKKKSEIQKLINHDSRKGVFSSFLFFSYYFFLLLFLVALISV